MKVIFLFPGYGAHFVGMCKELYDSSRLVQEYFEEASNCLSLNFVKLCFASSDSDLAVISHAYPALFLTSVAVSSALQEAGIQPDAVAGFGIGEFSALCTAKSINLPDGLYLLTKLATLYNSFNKDEVYNGIRVVGVSTRNLNKIVSEFEDDAFISYYISDEEHIVVGLADAVASIEQEVKTLKTKPKKLSVGYGLYSPLAQNILEEFKPHMVKVDIKDLKIPLISCHDGKEVAKGYAARERVSKSIVSPVKWQYIVKRLSEYDMIIEVGPKSHYFEQIKSQFPNALSVSKPEDLEAAKKMYAELQAVQDGDLEENQE